jgi:hypothetical protein
MRIRTVLLALLVTGILAFAALTASQAQAPSALLIRGATIIDGISDAPMLVVVWRPDRIRSLYRAFDRHTRGGAAVRVRQRGFEQEQQAHDQGRRDAHYGDHGDGELAP